MAGNLTLERLENGVAILRLDRPPVNALDIALLDEIDGTLTELEQADGVKALVVTGEGRSLSAGMNLKALAAMDATDERRTVEALNRTFGRLYAFPRPVVAAANGHAIAGGLFFVLTADYRIGAVGPARFGLTEIRLGVAFPVGALEIARAELPPAAARRMLLGGQTIGAGEAFAWGILDELAEPDDLLERAFAVAETYGGLPPQAYAAVKRQLRRPVLDRVERAINQADDPALESWITPEARDAIPRMLAK